jgi:hypothetical protein
MSAEQLVRIYYASLTQKPKIVDRTKMDKDKKRKDKRDRENPDKSKNLEKYKPKSKADIEAKRQKFKDQQRTKTAPYIKDDRKRKYDKGYDKDRYDKDKYDRHNYEKQWRHDDGQSRPSAPY